MTNAHKSRRTPRRAHSSHLAPGPYGPGKTTAPRLEVSLSGSFIALAQPSGKGTKKGETKRGRIGGFSRGARGRLFKRVAKVPREVLSKALFVTLTYPDDFSFDPRKWKEDLNRWNTWVKSEFPKISYVWKLEPQKRGAPHFHLLVFGYQFLDIHVLCDGWYRAVRSGDPKHLARGVDIDRVQKAQNAMAYVGKYIAKKPVQDETTRKLNWDSIYPGRWWGVVGAANFPSDSFEPLVTGSQWLSVKRWLAAYMARRGQRFSFQGIGGGWAILDGDECRKLLENHGVLVT